MRGGPHLFFCAKEKMMAASQMRHTVQVIGTWALESVSANHRSCGIGPGRTRLEAIANHVFDGNCDPDQDVVEMMDGGRGRARRFEFKSFAAQRQTTEISMRSRKINPKANPAHQTPPLVNQIRATESTPRNHATIKKSADAKYTAIPRAAERPNLGRHAANCRICKHSRRQDIEDDFVAWVSPAKIAVDYKLRDRSTIYRHARALNLFPKRRRNGRAALELIIEHAGDIEVNASAVVAAVQALAKLNGRGELIEPDEHLELHDLFDRMSPEEYEAYAKDGTLPRWFEDEIATAGGRVLEGGENG